MKKVIIFIITFTTAFMLLLFSACSASDTEPTVSAGAESMEQETIEIAQLISDVDVVRESKYAKYDAVTTGSTTTMQTIAAQTTKPQTTAAAEPAADTLYILNTNTKKFHRPNCASVKDMKDKNKQESDASRQEIIDSGYTPCGRCHP